MNANPVVTARLDCLTPDGERREVVVEIGHPYQVPEGQWACPVKIRGLYDRLRDIRGQDSLQALCLAASLVRTLLTAFVAGGGRIMFTNTDDAYELNAIFGNVGVALSDERP